MDTKNWYERVRARLVRHEEEATVSSKDMRFFRVDTLLSMGKHCAEKAELGCDTCANLRDKTEYVAEHLHEMLDGHTGHIKQYEEVYAAMESHLKGEHRMVYAKHTQAVYGILGMLAGVAVGYAVGYLVNPNGLRIFVLAGWFLGLLLARIAGGVKEKKLKKEARYL